MQRIRSPAQWWFFELILNITMKLTVMCCLLPLRRLNSTQGEIRVGPSHQVGHQTLLHFPSHAVCVCSYGRAGNDCALEMRACCVLDWSPDRPALGSDPQTCDRKAATRGRADDRRLEADTCMLFGL